MEKEVLGRRTSASTSCENRKRLSTITREFPVLEVSTFRYRKPISLISIPTPLKDFITFEMDKERLEGSSPRGVLDNCTRSLGSESDSSKTSTSDSEGNPTPRVTIQCRGFFQLFKSRSMRRQTSLPAPVNVPKMSKRSSRSMREKPAPSLKPPQELDFCYLKSSWKIFSLSELQAATKNFSSENMIGKGGYAEVYKGCLQDGQLVAIKRLTRGTLEERTGDFLSEIGIIVHVNHRNTAKLIGYGVEGGLHLVLQLSPHGSLASLLHGSKNVLEWSIRYKVALGTAEGLRYLHESCQRRIIHRDIKAANILLTEDFEPQISDFGLSKWLPEQWSHHTVLKFEGTFGYLAPEYFMHGIVDEKTDVFAFGVLLLELITGRRAIDNTQQSLVMWAKPLLDKNDIRELVDPALGDAYDSKQMNRMAMTASLCIQHSSILRPRMSQVVQLLRSEETGSDSLKQCRKPFLHRTYSELFDSEEYNLTRENVEKHMNATSLPQQITNNHRDTFISSWLPAKSLVTSFIKEHKSYLVSPEYFMHGMVDEKTHNNVNKMSLLMEFCC